MNEHHVSMARVVALFIVVMTFIISITIGAMQKDRLDAQAVPQVVIESDTP